MNDVRDKIMQAIADGSAIYASVKAKNDKLEVDRLAQLALHKEQLLSEARVWVSVTLPDILKGVSSTGAYIYEIGSCDSDKVNEAYCRFIVCRDLDLNTRVSSYEADSSLSRASGVTFYIEW